MLKLDLNPNLKNSFSFILGGGDWKSHLPESLVFVKFGHHRHALPFTGEVLVDEHAERADERVVLFDIFCAFISEKTLTFHPKIPDLFRKENLVVEHHLTEKWDASVLPLQIFTALGKPWDDLREAFGRVPEEIPKFLTALILKELTLRPQLREDFLEGFVPNLGVYFTIDKKHCLASDDDRHDGAKIFSLHANCENWYSFDKVKIVEDTFDF